MANPSRPARPATAQPAHSLRARNLAYKSQNVATPTDPPRQSVAGLDSALPSDALRILASLTPVELRALDRHLFSSCFYGQDEGAAMRGAQKLHRAAEAL